MQSFMLLGFVGILRESLKIFFKNVKLMASLTLLTLSLYSVFYLSNIFFIKPFITGTPIKQKLFLPVTDPRNPEFFLLLIDLKEGIRAFVGFEWIFVTENTTLIFATAMIIAVAMIRGGRNLSFGELLLSTVTSLKRPFFTWLYTTLLGFGYIFLVMGNLLPMIPVIQCSVATKVWVIILVILASVLHTYLAVIWNLAFVISVMEDKSGAPALEKAAQIVEGSQLHGFLLNSVFTILTFVIYQGTTLMTIKQSAAVPLIVGLFVINLTFLVKILTFVAYTIFYYQCKKTHGEEVELQWNTGYSKVPTLPPPDENIP